MTDEPKVTRVDFMPADPEARPFADAFVTIPRPKGRRGLGQRIRTGLLGAHLWLIGAGVTPYGWRMARQDRKRRA